MFENNWRTRKVLYWRSTKAQVTIDPIDDIVHGNGIWSITLEVFPSHGAEQSNRMAAKAWYTEPLRENQVSILTRILCYFNENMKLLMYLTMAYVNT